MALKAVDMGDHFTPKLNKFQLGDRVIVLGNPEKKGVVQFFGTVDFDRNGPLVGIELDEKKGKNNGMVDGRQYFLCDDKHGIFVRPDQVKRDESAAASGTSAAEDLFGLTPSQPEAADEQEKAEEEEYVPTYELFYDYEPGVGIVKYTYEETPDILATAKTAEEQLKEMAPKKMSKVTIRARTDRALKDFKEKYKSAREVVQTDVDPMDGSRIVIPPEKIIRNLSKNKIFVELKEKLLQRAVYHAEARREKDEEEVFEKGYTTPKKSKLPANNPSPSSPMKIGRPLFTNLNVQRAPPSPGKNTKREGGITVSSPSKSPDPIAVKKEQREVEVLRLKNAAQAEEIRQLKKEIDTLKRLKESPLKVPEVPMKERTPTVESLLAVIREQIDIINKLSI